VANFAGENDPCGLYAHWLANVEMFSIPNGELYQEMLCPGVVPNGEFYNEMLSLGVVPSGEFCRRA
jgi:hypothetical protein